MKQLRILTIIPVMLIACIYSSIIAFCDGVDDLCSKYDWDYRWTVSVELDETYEDTWLWKIASDNKIEISYIMLKNALEAKNSDGITESVFSVYVVKGDEELIVTGLDGSRSIENHGDGFRIYECDEKESALYPLTRSRDMREDKFGVIGCYGYQNDGNQRFALICQYSENPTLTPQLFGVYTPILITYEVLKEAEDTTAAYPSRRMYMRYIQKKALSATKYLYAEAIVRENRREPKVFMPLNPAREVLDDEEIMLENGITAYDIDRSTELQRARMYTYNQWARTVDGNFDLVPMWGRIGLVYCAHIPWGKLEYDVTVRRSLPEADITDDGKLHVTVELFRKYNAVVGEAEEYGIKKGSFAYVVKYEGNRGVQYGYGPLYIGKNRDIESEYDIYSAWPNTLKSYDSELAVIQRRPVMGNLYNCPLLNFAFDKENGMMTAVGLSFRGNDDLFLVPIENANIDESAEMEITAAVTENRTLARYTVEAARAERTQNNLIEVEIDESIMFMPTPEKAPDLPKVEYNGDIMFIPVPTAQPTEIMLRDPAAPPEQEEKVEIKQEEPEENVSHEDENIITEEAKKKDNGIEIKIFGESISFDVAPVINNDRVLVPMRAIFEKLGESVLWNEKEGKATVHGNGTDIEFYVNNSKVRINDKEKYMDTPTGILMGRTMIPLRFFSEELGYKVNWDEETRSVSIE